MTAYDTIRAAMGASLAYRAVLSEVHAPAVRYAVKVRCLAGIVAVRVAVEPAGTVALTCYGANDRVVARTTDVRPAQLRETLKYYVGV